MVTLYLAFIIWFLATGYYHPEWCRFLNADSIEYLEHGSVNGLNLFAYCSNNPVNMVDPSGHFAISTLTIGLIIGALISTGTAYAIDVVNNFEDGFDWSDFNTIEDNWKKYLLAGIGGAVAGAFGAVGNAGLSFLGSFMGNMIERAYTFTSAENVGYAIWTSLLSGALAGGFTAIGNKITKAYFNKTLSNASKGVQKQMGQFLKHMKKLPTKDTATQLIKGVEKAYSFMGSIGTISTTVLGLFY